MFDRALAIAQAAHSGQKYSDQPYIEHSKRVASRVALYTDDALAQIVAILHDTVEDTIVTLKQIETEFGPEIAADIESLTKRNGEEYNDYIKRLAARPRARIVKIADLQDNIEHASLPDAAQKVRGLLPRYREALEYLLSLE